MPHWSAQYGQCVVTDSAGIFMSHESALQDAHREGDFDRLRGFL